ncbi:MAG: hypothetical protein EOP08_12810, partial [Proteobacteria bacterium]
MYDGWRAGWYGKTPKRLWLAFDAERFTGLEIDGNHAILARAFGPDLKGRFTPVLYVAGIATSFIRPWIGQA